jgi:hypothetical protein
VSYTASVRHTEPKPPALLRALGWTGAVAFSAARDVVVLAAGAWLARYAWEQWQRGLFHPPFIGYRKQ